MIGAIFLQIVLIFLNAIFASAEMAVVSMNNVKLDKMVQEGNKKAVRLVKLTANQARFLATIQVAITLAGFLGSAYAADNFAKPLVQMLIKTGVRIPETVLNSVCVFLITLIIAYFSIVFGELIPKRIALQRNESLALMLSGPLVVVSVIFAPIVWLLTASTNGVLKLFGIDPNEEEQVTEEEIRMMVAAGSKRGTIDLDENEMIQNIFEFDDITLEEVCTHRIDIKSVELEDDLDEWDKIIYETKYQYYPIYGDTTDDIIGILDSKDYLRMNDRTKEKVLEEAVKKPYYVPENMKADVLLQKMKKTGNYFVVVIDEYGGMSGIVTMRDLIELLVGELIEDDEEQKPEDIEFIKEGEWLIQGGASLDEVAELLKVELPIEEYDTFGGYICGAYGEVPDDGMSFELECDGLFIHVNTMKDRRVGDAVVKIMPSENAEDMIAATVKI